MSYENDTSIYIRRKVQSCSNFSTYYEPTERPMRSPTINPNKIPGYKQTYNDNDNNNDPDDNDNNFAVFTRSSHYDSCIMKDDDPEKSKSSDNTDNTDNIAEEWNIEEPPSAISNKSQLNYDSFANLCKTTPKTLRASLSSIINNLFENPEGRMKPTQRIAICIFSAFEAYRTLISSFLTVFVPQNCGGYSCTILQNIIPKDKLETAAISFNAFMAFYFFVLFATERVREDIVKKYLISDKSRSTDKEYLIKMLSEMKLREQNNILRVTRVYRTLAQFLLILFFVNASISCVVIRKNYLNNTTTTVFITNTFFMINRIYKTLKITSSGEYNIYSAYRTDSLLYNRYRGDILHSSNTI
jgi:hypothetical protein